MQFFIIQEAIDRSGMSYKDYMKALRKRHEIFGITSILNITGQVGNVTDILI